MGFAVETLWFLCQWCDCPTPVTHRGQQDRGGTLLPGFHWRHFQEGFTFPREAFLYAPSRRWRAFGDLIELAGRQDGVDADRLNRRRTTSRPKAVITQVIPTGNSHHQRGLGNDAAAGSWYRHSGVPWENLASHGRIGIEYDKEPRKSDVSPENDQNPSAAKRIAAERIAAR